MRPVKLEGLGGLTQQKLMEFLSYDPETGIFTRRVQTTPAVKVGDVAGGLRKSGYTVICVAGELAYAHRLAFLYMTGEWPKGQVDHMDGCRSNNRWVNLRDAPDRINPQNRRRPSRHNKSGLLGVSKFGRNWIARIHTDGKTHKLGVFAVPEEAHEAYLKAKRKLHEGCTI